MTINLKNNLEELNKSSNPNIWENKDAKDIFQNIKIFENKISDFNKLKKLVEETEEILIIFKKIMMIHF